MSLWGVGASRHLVTRLTNCAIQCVNRPHRTDGQIGRWMSGSRGHSDLVTGMFYLLVSAFRINAVSRPRRTTGFVGPLLSTGEDLVPLDLLHWI